MVSLWPFRGDSSDAAAFEKTLSTLAQKISKNGAHLDRLRQSSRKIKVMWTLYTIVTYILAALILTLVTGWHNWGKVEVSGLASGPVIIYGVRRGLSAYYDYRIRSASLYHDSLLQERDATIEKLKTATKYNSTQQLLEKYGSAPKQPPQPKTPKNDPAKKAPSGPQPNRTNVPPPPTANIPRGPQPRPISAGGPGPSPPATANIPRGPPPGFPPPPSSPPTAEFAPNAFDTSASFRPAPLPASYSQGPMSPKWYDRILDVLVGEDENAATNRFALICKSCKLVNGLAPPGTRTLEEVGGWRCSGCGSLNGEDKGKSEVEKVIGTVSTQSFKIDDETAGDESGLGESMVEVEREPERLPPDSDEELEDVGETTATPAQSTRSRRKATKA